MKFSEFPYSRVDLDKAIEEGRKLIRQAEKAASGEVQWAVHQNFCMLQGHVRTASLIATIRRDGDMTDAFYEAEKDYYDREMPRFQAVVNEYQKILSKTPYRAFMEEKLGPVPFKSMELSMKAFDDKLIPLMQEEIL